MTKLPRILLLVPDGVGFRNFVLGSLPSLLVGRAELVLLHALPAAALEQAELETRFRSVEQMPTYREGIVARVLRDAKSLGQIFWRKAEDAGDLQLEQRRPRGRLRSRALGHAARVLARLVGGPRRLEWIARCHERVLRYGRAARGVRKSLREMQPDLVFCTHQRASTATPWMAVARELGIPTATFVFSWDNPPKGRMAVAADEVLVWGEAMREELQVYEPSRSKETLHVVGTPQFEPYFEATSRSRTEFCVDHGLDPNRPIVCFSGGDYASSPRDPDYLADLALALRGEERGSRAQILFRRSPADTSDRHRRVLERFPEIAECPPLWLAPTVGDWQHVMPTAEDLRLLNEVVQHCDTVVNVGSTMALDFALQDKPSLYVAYEPSGEGGPPEPEGSFGANWSLLEAYRLPHFRLVHELDPVVWVRSRDDLALSVATVLEGNDGTELARAAWIERLLTAPLQEASERIACTLLEIAGCRE